MQEAAAPRESRSFLLPMRSFAKNIQEIFKIAGIGI